MTKTITLKIVPGSFAHEYRVKGDLHTSYGFGSTPEEAREDAVYGPDREGDAARDHSQGFGNWRLQEDSDGEHWLTKVA